MFKEVMISIIIIVLIFSLDIITQTYTMASVAETSSELDNLKGKIENQNDNLDINIDKISSNWEKRRQKLSYFIEHDELEKVETNLTNIKSYIESAEFNMAISSIDEAKFILEHIKEKNAFNLENIF